ncbi:MAG TPA: NAD-dependent epimerase/dehydratase family protein [Paracoccaceae bacterium]|nr:NAD-dependent epimerase/dehydratase family protein [Paracoccaceae bacterium]
MNTQPPNFDTSAPVLVTGATGFVAGWVVKRLLEEGFTVHAAVRDPQNAEKLKHLNAIAAETAGNIRFFKSDLLDEGSYAEAMEGCSVVFHTASPFTLAIKDPQKDLIDPALIGTRNVLTQASQTDSVRRVVVTSSCAAIYCDAADCASAPNGVLTEDVWNTRASLGNQPYSYSKTLAEKEAWKIAQTQTQWDLVTVNPSLVMGPAIGGNPTSESYNIMRQLGNGMFKMGAPKAGIGIVDVRDLADAHLAAAFIPSANGRNIISAHNSDLFEVLNTLAQQPLSHRALRNRVALAVLLREGVEHLE